MRLCTALASEGGIQGSVDYSVVAEDAQDFVDSLVRKATEPGGSGKVIPSFFFVDPYGHPITLPAMRRILRMGQTELLVNLMWFQVNRDLYNPTVQARVDRLFGHSDWRRQPFMASVLIPSES